MAAKKKASEPAAAGGGRLAHGSAGVGGQRLSPGDITARLAAVPGWRAAGRGQAIARTYALPSFRAVLAFVGFVGELAEARNHHPDIDIRYDKVTLTLSTHDAGGLTARDFELARLIDGAG